MEWKTQLYGAYTSKNGNKAQQSCDYKQVIVHGIKKSENKFSRKTLMKKMSIFIAN